MNTIPSSLSKEQILENHRVKDDAGPHWITVKLALEAMEEYAAQQLQPPGTSDAVEFGQWILKEEWYAEEGFWYDYPFTGNSQKITSHELYALFLQTKQSAGNEKEK